jgi:hypothetical protein
MTKSVKLALLLSTLVLVAAWAAPAQATICGSPAAPVTLFAGQTTNAGSVTVSNDASFIYVEYTTTDPWQLIEAHLAIASTLDGIPQTHKNNPIPGRFPYSASFSPEVSDYVFAIPIGSFSAGTNLFIAAHAVVVGSGSETAWGAGTGFLGANWGTYFQYTVQSCGGGPE